MALVRKIDLYHDKNNFISTKEELIELLKKYKGILNSSIIEYLNYLIELEFSVIKDYIGEEERLALSELELYKKIAIYNIYNRALNIFNTSAYSFNIFGNDEGNKGLSVSINIGNTENSIRLFEYSCVEPKVIVPNDYKSKNMGNISLFRTIESKTLIEAEISRIKECLKYLYDLDESQIRRKCFLEGYDYAYLVSQNKQQIADYEKKLVELTSRGSLTDDEKREIEITGKFNTLFLEDYGLTNMFLEEEKEDSVGDNEDKTKLKKSLVIKRIPNLIVSNNIKYI